MYKIIFLYFAGLVASASAIVVQDYTAAETAPSGLDWSHVYNYNGSSAVAVGGGWLLTAAHVADDGPQPPDPYSLSIGGTVYNQQEIVYHTDGADRADLALVRFDRDFPGYYPLYTEQNPNSLVGLGVLVVGFGTTGAVYTDYFTASGAGRNTQRWGSQVIDRARPFNYPAGGMVGYTKNLGFWMDFDLGHTTHEAGTGSGDSGGGTFYNDGGIWKLVGIMTSRQEGEVAGQYTGTYAVSMPAYADWISDTIPEPATIGLMSLSTMGLFFTRSLQRRKNRIPARIGPIRGTYLCDSYGALETCVADGEGWAYVDYLPRMQEMVHANPLPVWMNTLHTRYKALNIVVVKSLDTLLDKIYWNRLATSMKSERDSMALKVKRSFVKCLDAFLEKIAWDQKFSAYKRRKKAIRTAFMRND